MDNANAEGLGVLDNRNCTLAIEDDGTVVPPMVDAERTFMRVDLPALPPHIQAWTFAGATSRLMLEDGHAIEAPSMSRIPKMFASCSFSTGAGAERFSHPVVVYLRRPHQRRICSKSES